MLMERKAAASMHNHDFSVVDIMLGFYDFALKKDIPTTAVPHTFQVHAPEKLEDAQELAEMAEKLHNSNSMQIFLQTPFMCKI